MSIHLSQLPEIKIVRHARAKCLRLRVQPTQIRLTAPVLCSKRQIQNFIEQSEVWLLKTWQQQQQKIATQEQSLPTELKLFNLNCCIQVAYQTQKQNFIFDVENLHLYISDREPKTYLKAFVMSYAKQHLPIYLQKIAQACVLDFTQCTVRQAKTRWGSCTSKHAIMLNSALVLMSKEITRYVCVHELAHTQHFDHSARFWSLVEKHDSHFQQHRKILKSTAMPFWWQC